MDKETCFKVIALISLCILAMANNTSSLQEIEIADSVTSHNTFLGVSTENNSLDQTGNSNTTNSNVSGHYVPGSVDCVCQPTFDEANETSVTNPVSYNNDDIYPKESRPENSESPSGSELQLALVMVLTAMIFFVSQTSPYKKDPSAYRTH